MYTHHCHNTDYVTYFRHCKCNVYFQHTGLLGYMAGWRVLTQTCQPARQQCCGNLTFRSYYFSNLTQLYDRVNLYFRTMKYYLGIRFISVILHFCTFKPILMVKLRFLHFNYWKENPKFLRISPVVCVPLFEKHCNIGPCFCCDMRVHFAE